MAKRPDQAMTGHSDPHYPTDLRLTLAENWMWNPAPPVTGNRMVPLPEVTWHDNLPLNLPPGTPQGPENPWMVESFIVALAVTPNV